jgi:hypothetical protein
MLSDSVTPRRKSSKECSATAAPSQYGDGGQYQEELAERPLAAVTSVLLVAENHHPHSGSLYGKEKKGESTGIHEQYVDPVSNFYERRPRPDRDCACWGRN